MCQSKPKENFRKTYYSLMTTCISICRVVSGYWMLMAYKKSFRACVSGGSTACSFVTSSPRKSRHRSLSMPSLDRSNRQCLKQLGFAKEKNPTADDNSKTRKWTFTGTGGTGSAQGSVPVAKQGPDCDSLFPGTDT